MAGFTSSSDILLTFDRTLVVVGGGTLDLNVLNHLHEQGAAVVAADSGADYCMQAGITPAAIIGDLDSLDDVDGWALKTKVIRLDEQINTDFEKCLYSTKAPVTVALGMTGKRFDHTMAAVHAVQRFGADRHIILIDETDIALGVVGDFSFEVEKGDRVSTHQLVPIAHGRSQGLEYQMEGLTLAPGVRTGSSNRAIEGPFTVKIAEGEEGMWLLIVDLKYLDSLITSLLPKTGV